MKRTLTLSRETLAELSSTELGSVVGGAITAQGRTCPLIDCAGLESWVGHCPTLPECP
ncbi:MAG TPA: hypothetical protein VF519_10440 [Mycobacteriales bacterium]